ncbi:autotransporter domain-containing protein [Ancylobacter sp. FA202]|uniref:autotransporter outer membrane beta-barrel domain-containing protein n=1 Tax=Ancylobacter sp. FA202 TaxID=1111106 RepID=UPI0003777B45|nr:autotransporter domain-containing protein [Ancylobacter sp. FA202]
MLLPLPKLSSRGLRRLLLASAAVMVAGSAQAQVFVEPGTGGAGGGAGSGGGAGGAPSYSGQGTAGQDGTGTPAGAPSYGGGGGGSGLPGGSGGASPNSSPAVGGAGGSSFGASGAAGGNGGDGGGGGGGGAHGYAAFSSAFVAGTYTGGAGGAGGSATSYGGGGGGGGYGAVVYVDTSSASLDGTFVGGNGGAGGIGGTSSGTGGTAGGGLLVLDTLGGATINVAQAASATGGVGGGATHSSAQAGSGGAGLVVANSTGLTTLNSNGTVTGGAGGVGTDSATGGTGGIGLIITADKASDGITANINNTVTGGAGGSSSGAAPKGGYGGYGIYAGNPSSSSDSGKSIVNVNANVTGGAGGAASGGGGTAGDGATGIGAINSTITVASGVTVSGGAGGVGTYPVADGVGGTGIGGSGILVVLEGTATVQGGLGGDGVTRAAAISFGNGVNTLELRADENGNLPILIGSVTHSSQTDVLALGGTNDKTIDGDTLGGYANGFGALSKTGTSTWTLTGELVESALPWTIYQGTLSISEDVNLGGSVAGVTLSGGTLLATENIDFTHETTVSANGGTLSVVDGKTLTLMSSLDGSGALAKAGAGTLTLTAGNKGYAGAVTVSAGTLALSGAGSVADASSVTLGKATLDISESKGARIRNLASTEATSKVVLGDKTLSADVNSTSSFAGVIEGTGRVVVIGGGEFTLSGDNTYTGTTEVNGAYLYIGAGGTTGSVAGDISLDATSMLVFNRSNTVTIANSITTAAGSNITFQGGGNFSYTGSGTILGSVSVQDGTTLRLTGDQFAGASRVDAYGGVIAGNGTVSALTIHEGGTAAPGNSPGTLNATTVSFEKGATYQVDVTPSGEHDLIIASGAATISDEAKVEVVAVPGRYEVDTKYAILTAAGGVTGNFGSVTDNYIFLDAALESDDNNIYLLLHYTGANFADYALTKNQFTTATAAQALGAGNAVYDALLQQTATSAPGAFNALSGEAYASVGSVIQQQSVYLRDAVGSRLMQALTAPGVSPLAYGPGPVKAQLAEGYTPTLWLEGYGGWGDTFSNGNAATISNSIGGFLMGADVAVAENARAGLFAGYSQSDFDVTGRSSSGSMDNVDIGLYAGAQFANIALRGGAAYTWHDVSMSRSVVFPGFFDATEGDFTTGTTQVFGELGYDMELGAVAFEPFVGLAYVNVSGASFAETGGAAALAVSTGGMDTVYSTLGLRAATTVQLGGKTLTPHATLGWQHAFGDTSEVSTMQFLGGATPFSVTGVPIAEDALLLEAGLTYALSDTASLGASYTGQLASGASQNAFTVQFGMKF